MKNVIPRILPLLKLHNNSNISSAQKLSMKIKSGSGSGAFSIVKLCCTMARGAKRALVATTEAKKRRKRQDNISISGAAGLELTTISRNYHAQLTAAWPQKPRRHFIALRCVAGAPETVPRRARNFTRYKWLQQTAEAWTRRRRARRNFSKLFFKCTHRARVCVWWRMRGHFSRQAIEIPHYAGHNSFIRASRVNVYSTLLFHFYSNSNFIQINYIFK